MRFGKPLTKFLGMAKLLKAASDKNKDLSDILIYNTDGLVLYSLTESKIGKSVAAPLRVGIKTSATMEHDSQTAFNLFF